MASVDHLVPHASFGEHGRTRLARTRKYRGRGGEESKEEAVGGKKTESNGKRDQTTVDLGMASG